MKFFAMIDGQQKGPLELEEVADAGVRPDTYVWCKGMPDWAPASQVPDICRYFRLRLAGVLPPKGGNAAARQDKMLADMEAEQEQLLSQLPPMARNAVRKSGVKLRKEDFGNASESKESRWLPVVIYTLCTILIIIGFLLLNL